MEYLKSSDKNFDEDVIRDAFDALFGLNNIDCFFEHGQWWITDPDSGQMWSVVDAAGGPSTVCHGLSFEEV